MGYHRLWPKDKGIVNMTELLKLCLVTSMPFVFILSIVWFYDIRAKIRGWDFEKEKREEHDKKLAMKLCQGWDAEIIDRKSGQKL